MVDVDFLCKIENRIILKGLLYCANFIRRSMSSAYLK